MQLKILYSLLPPIAYYESVSPGFLHSSLPLSVCSHIVFCGFWQVAMAGGHPDHDSLRCHCLLRVLQHSG